MFDAESPLPPTHKQLAYAQTIASRLRKALTSELKTDKRALSSWIDQHQAAFKARQVRSTGEGATSRQVGFAERLARAKRRAIPDECFRSRDLMSRWIDSNR